MSETLKLFQHGFENNFQNYQVRKEMSESAWNESVDFLKSQGYKYFHKRGYFNDSLNPNLRTPRKMS